VHPQYHLNEAEHDPRICPLLQQKKFSSIAATPRWTTSLQARDHATHVVQSFTNEGSLEDLRDRVLHVGDDWGDELLVVPFTFVLTRPD
jgi:hypothetical protein